MKLYLGIDASTQGIKAEIIDLDAGTILEGAAVNFGRDLPEYDSPSGFLPNGDILVKHADPLMWLDALELLLAKLAKSGVDLSQIAGISGSGQQHGSVYLKENFAGVLASLSKEKSLASQLACTLSRPTSPIWMDRSTARECAELAAAFGDEVEKRTGSGPLERFTGPQIRKFSKDSPQNYRQTACIHLVSSFLCSVLCGKSAPLDYGDGAGMNLLNLQTRRWDPEITAVTAPGLIGKLPKIAPCNTIAGTLSPFFEKYGLCSGTPVAVWSGDNPSSLIGMGASEAGTAVISLGTSDTLFAAMDRFKSDPDRCGSVFGNPAGGFMSLICFTNGSLAREKIRETCAMSYQEFDCAAAKGGGNMLMLPYFEPESTPLVLTPGIKTDFDLQKASNADIVRALLESQMLSMRFHSDWIGEKFTRLRLTGGASKSNDLCQIAADVFGAEAEVISIGNSAGLGAALRAANTVEGIGFEKLFQLFSKPVKVFKPDASKKTYYQSMLEKFIKFESAK